MKLTSHDFVFFCFKCLFSVYPEQELPCRNSGSLGDPSRAGNLSLTSYTSSRLSDLRVHKVFFPQHCRCRPRLSLLIPGSEYPFATTLSSIAIHFRKALHSHTMIRFKNKLSTDLLPFK